MLFADRVAAVTGASSGIGRAIALTLNAQGAGVRLIGRNAAALEATAACARTAPVWRDALDITDDRCISELARRIESECGALDILVHAAGIFSMSQVEAASAEDFDAQYRTNLRAPFMLSQALLPLLRRRQGQIVFVNSTAGTAARRGVSQYSATKHGLKAIADSLREEVNGQGIRVLSIFLGRTATPMQERVHQFENRKYEPDKLIQPEDVGLLTATVLGLPRTVEVVDIFMRPFVPPANAPIAEGE